MTMKQANYNMESIEKSYLNTTHKCNLTGSELSTLLYILDDWIEEHKEYKSSANMVRDINRIYTELESVTDNYYAQLEEKEWHLVSTN